MDLRLLYRGEVVAVGGPPHSGKSVFLASLYRELLRIRPQNFVFLVRQCPDGEGMWSAESSPDMVQRIRCKGKFTEHFLRDYLPQIQGPALLGTFKLLLADLGGIRSEENAEILRNCTHLIILSSKEEETKKWVEFGEKQGCNTIALFKSKLVHLPNGELDMNVRSTVNLTGDCLATGELLNLDRKTLNNPYIDTVREFARWLIEILTS
jgi:CRISPR-associated protein Csx3